LYLSPPNATTRFSSNQIKAYFDEYLQLSDINNQLIVSPPLREQPDVKIKKRSVILTFNESLLENVTYTLNFGEGIKDFTEGNPAELLYVFSTGDVLDSLELSGYVNDAYTGDPLGGVRVMLYRDTALNQPLEEKPYYFARSNSEGIYRFRYLAEGQYRLFALDEQNMNYVLDDPDERFAFSDSLVVPGTPSDSLVLGALSLSKGFDSTLYVNAFSADSSGFLRMTLNRAWDALGQLEVSDTTLGGHVYFMAPDSLFAWTHRVADREIEWYFQSPTVTDTFEVPSFQMAPRTLGVRKKPEQSVNSDDTIAIAFNRPLQAIDTSKVRFYRDSIAIPFGMNRSKNPFESQILGNLDDGNNYRIEANPGAFTSREGFTNDSLRISFSTHPADHYGQLFIDISATEFEGTPRLQLYNPNKKDAAPVREVIIAPESTIALSRLLPGTYKLRLIDDRNNNGKWDPANYLLQQQPERVYNLREEISVRSNWDLEIFWTLD
jgi:hypothetical protein